MSIIQKMLDALNMENWNTKDSSNTIRQEEFEFEKDRMLNDFRSKIEYANELINEAQDADDKEKFYDYVNEIRLIFSEFLINELHEETITSSDNREQKRAYDRYYSNINKQKENNLHITYEDVKGYDEKPFDLKGKFISDENFTTIELSGHNLEIAYEYLKEINFLLSPHKNLYEDAEFPEKISIEYDSNRKFPISHLRLMPYTATMKKSKYPLCLWLSSVGDYGTEYIYSVYFNREGDIGQCELSLHGSDGIGVSYETKIRRNQYGLYILRISKTLYSPPYGTTTIYHSINNENTSISTTIENKSNSKPKPKHMSNYEIEQYAKECNAYAIREERKEQNKLY
ncbi:MAG: hypothetical protein HDQ95_14085 [Roseburia sp.]|nr:hypothetical protein [Roseburia sp.]